MREARRFRSIVSLTAIAALMAASAPPTTFALAASPATGEPSAADCEKLGFAGAGDREELGGSSIVVTGSTRGIGKGIAAEILKRGHNVIISGRSAAAVEAALADLAPLASGGARVVGSACDVSRRDELQRLWDSGVAAFGRLDIWVNNAGVSHPRQRGGEMGGAMAGLCAMLLVAILSDWMQKAALGQSPAR